MDEIIGQLRSMKMYELHTLEAEVHNAIRLRAQMNRAEALEQTAERYFNAICDITGVDIRAWKRDRVHTWGRYIVAYQLVEDGYSMTAAGAAVSRDHSTVYNAVKQMRAMLNHPMWYTDEYEIYKEFQARIR